jgi:hypothetical protein
MSNPNLDIEFTYSSINAYYLAKTATYNALPLSHTVFSSIDEFVKHLTIIHNKYDIALPKQFTWGEVATKNVWLYREYAFASIMILVGRILRTPSSWKSPIHRSIPDDLDGKKNRFTVIGSQMITSDIDVSVQGHYSTVIIAILEDFFEFLTNKYHIPLMSMDIQYYSDFRILTKLFVNVSLFSEKQRYEMLKYAYISYFRSLHLVKPNYTVSPLARRLGLIYLKQAGGGISLKRVLEDAFEEWHRSAPNGKLDREKFYDENEKTEFEALMLEQHIDDKGVRNAIAQSSFVGTLANDIFFSLARGHIHRPESYILPSTAVHIVEIEQVLDNKMPTATKIAPKWFTDNAGIGVDNFAYIASAIEQLGYLEHYHQGNEHCNKKGVKYFGRMVRGLLHAGLLDDAFIPIYNGLNEYRKADDEICPYDIQKLFTIVKAKLLPKVNKTRRSLTIK